MTQSIYPHKWVRERVYDVPHLKCVRCGLIVDEVFPGVPNLYGSIEREIDCNDSVIQQVHEENNADIA